jgi:exonuclease III
MSRFLTFTLLLLSISVSTFARAESAFTLRVMTFNIQGLPAPATPADTMNRFRAIAKILADLRQAGKAPHVIVLQEAFLSDWRTIRDVAGYAYSAFGPGGAALKTNSGLAILSDFPLRKLKSMIYTSCTSWDCFARKGAVQLSVQIPGVSDAIGGIEILNTHLNAYSNPDATAARLRQITQFGKFVDQLGTTPGLRVIAGDFNSVYGREDFEHLESALRIPHAASTCIEREACAGDPLKEQVAYRAKSLDHQFWDSHQPPSRVLVEPVFFDKTLDWKVNGLALSDHAAQEVHYKIHF